MVINSIQYSMKQSGVVLLALLMPPAKQRVIVIPLAPGDVEFWTCGSMRRPLGRVGVESAESWQQLDDPSAVTRKESPACN